MLIVMKLVVYFNMISTIQVVAKQPGHLCSVISDDRRQCFVKDLILSAEHNGNQLAVDKKSNTLYLSFDAGQGEFSPAALSLNTKKLKLLRGVNDAFAIASDDSTGNIYFGGSNGIYKYVPLERKLMRLNFKNLDVWWLFVQQNIFYIQFPDLNAYVYIKKSIKYLKTLRRYAVHQLVFDSKNNIIFLNASGLYGVKKTGSNQPVLLKNNVKFTGLAVNNEGIVHICSDDGIYIVNSNLKEKKVTRIANVQGASALTFDRNNHLIYSNSHDLVRLLPVHRREVSALKVLSKQNSLKTVSVCNKVCDVLKMRVN